jgi:hypothetical protein
MITRRGAEKRTQRVLGIFFLPAGTFVIGCRILATPELKALDKHDRNRNPAVVLRRPQRGS